MAHMLSMKVNYQLTHRYDGTQWHEQVIWVQQPTQPVRPACIHDQCPQCGGTGIKKDGSGVCVHMISCPCPKCTPVCY